MTPLEKFFHDNGHDVLNPPKLFESQRAAHDALMDVVGEVMQELRAENVPIPSEKQFLKTMAEMSAFYRRFAPPEPLRISH